ncbi:hypothetical protein V6N11_052149 [Hibiscus sabdariffa]|uniref:t-SNARE coiled-coil homology domain-containing protein n=1 Tax=Hibiscus sabdariffa TaxID=183260 RepID=A0ABR2U956_9ROSI
MASSSDTWIKEYNEAVRLADDINGMISGKSSLPASGPETQRHASAIRRKITILGTRLDGLQSLLSRPTGKPLDSLLGPDTKPDAMSRTVDLDNSGLVADQDEGLEKLEETVISTKHIALAVGEELDLHTRLIGDLNHQVDVTDSRLQKDMSCHGNSIAVFEYMIIEAVFGTDQDILNYGDRDSPCRSIPTPQILVITPSTPHPNLLFYVRPA